MTEEDKVEKNKNMNEKGVEGSKKVVKDGSEVSLIYVGRTDDGVVFDEVKDKEHPFKFKVGSKQVLPKFEEALKGLGVGDKKSIHLSSKEAYGDVKDSLFVELPRNLVDTKIELEKGKRLVFRTPDGSIVYAVVKDFNDSTVKLDLNHPLAGKNLNFDVEIVGVD